MSPSESTPVFTVAVVNDKLHIDSKHAAYTYARSQVVGVSVPAPWEDSAGVTILTTDAAVQLDSCTEGAFGTIRDWMRAEPPVRQPPGSRYDQALEVIIGDDDDELTLREYFGALLTTLWVEGEGFSGKRPFGDSGWQHDVSSALSSAGFAGLDVEDLINYALGLDT